VTITMEGELNEALRASEKGMFRLFVFDKKPRPLTNLPPDSPFKLKIADPNMEVDSSPETEHSDVEEPERLDKDTEEPETSDKDTYELEDADKEMVETENIHLSEEEHDLLEEDTYEPETSDKDTEVPSTSNKDEGPKNAPKISTSVEAEETNDSCSLQDCEERFSETKESNIAVTEQIFGSDEVKDVLAAFDTNPEEMQQYVSGLKPIGSEIRGLFKRIYECSEVQTILDTFSLSSLDRLFGVGEEEKPQREKRPRRRSLFASKLSSSLISDGILGDTLFPREECTKIWEIENDGSEAWPENCRLVFVGGDEFSALTEIVVPPVCPGDETTVAVDIQAPSKPGSYQSKWKLVTPAGQSFGKTFRVSITVAQPVVETPPEVDSELASNEEIIFKGQTVKKSVEPEEEMEEGTRESVEEEVSGDNVDEVSGENVEEEGYAEEVPSTSQPQEEQSENQEEEIQQEEPESREEEESEQEEETESGEKETGEDEEEGEVDEEGVVGQYSELVGHLVAMGFTDSELNSALLAKRNGDITLVVGDLLNACLLD